MTKNLTDLHTHILPGIDDGAEDLENALQMLREQKQCGVERVALTPHFYPLRMELPEFLEKRQEAYETLLANWDKETMPELRLGAEARYSTALADMDLRQLTIGQGKYLLLELSNTSVPSHIETVMKVFQQQGIIPILAHVERCVYFCQEPERLFSLVEQGALAQVSTKSIADKKRHFARLCIKRNIAQILASDMHHLHEKKLCLGNTMDVDSVDKDMFICAEQFAKAVWDDEKVPSFDMSPVQKKWYGYR